jgi:hypothetical protein
MRENSADFSDLDQRFILGKVLPDERKAAAAQLAQPRQPRFFQRHIVIIVHHVQPHHAVAARQQAHRKAVADETRRARYQYLHRSPLWPGFQGIFAWRRRVWGLALPCL